MTERSERTELARRARVLALDDATPPAEQSAEWARDNGARSERDAVRDVRTIWRDERGPLPRTVATIAGRRTMVSAIPSTVDQDTADDQGGYAFLAGITGDESGAPRESARPSGAPRHVGRSEQGEALAHHETRARRSRKGRTTFDTLRHHKRPRPVTSEPSGLDGLDSLGLIAVADSMLRAAGVDPVDVSGTTDSGKSRGSYLLGTDAASAQWAQMVRRDRAARDEYNVAIHHVDLMTPFTGGRAQYGRNVVLVVHGHLGVVHAGAVRPSGSKRASWRPTIWHAPESIADSHVPAPTVRPETKLSWPRRLRIRGTARKGERQGWERLKSGQYVRRATSTTHPTFTGYGALALRAMFPTICHAWDADPDRAWFGHEITARPAAGRTESGKSRKRASDAARDKVPESASTMTDAEADRIVRDAVAAGTLTMVQRSQGRLSVTHRRADGSVHTWRARNVRAVAARIAQ